MNRIRWQLRTWLSLLNREGKFGLILLAVALCVYIIVFIPGQTRINQLHDDIASLTTTNTIPARLEHATTSDQLATFYRFFPPQQSAPDWLDKIYQAARHENLALNEGKYRAKHQREGLLYLYEVTLPVTGSYSQIQHFLAAIMKDIPVVALDGVTFERSQIGDASINAKIKLTLYLGQIS